MTQRPWSYGDALDEQIKDHFDKGYTIYKSAEELGVSRCLIRKRRNFMGLPVRRGRRHFPHTGSKPIEDFNDRIKELYELGFTTREIADDPDVYISASTVRSRLKEMGFDTGHKKRRARRIPYQKIAKVEELLNSPELYTYHEIVELSGLNTVCDVYYIGKTHIKGFKPRTQAVRYKAQKARERRIRAAQNRSLAQTLRVQPS